MKRWNIFLSLVILILFSINHSYAFRKSRVLFYYVKAGEGITTEHVELLKKAFRNAIRKNPKFELVSDENIELVFEKYGISEDGCTTTECAVKIGADPQISADFSMYGELKYSDEGVFLINARVVSIEKKSILWEPLNLKKAESVSKFISVANAIIEEFAKTIKVVPQIKEVRADGRVIIDIGAQLGMRKGEKYWVVRELQLDVFSIVRDTLGLVEVEMVADELSLAKVLNKRKSMVKRAKLFAYKGGELDEVPPVIEHQPVLTAGKQMEIPIDAEISDNNKLMSAFLFYSANMNGPFNSIPMTKKAGQQNIYQGIIPATVTSTASKIYYYIQAKDAAGNVRTLQSSAGVPFVIELKTSDVIPPQITFNPPAQKPKTNEIIFTAKVMDDVRVRMVWLFYKAKAHQPFIQMPMSPFAEHDYGASVPFDQVQADTLWYYIQAEDFAGNKNFVGKPEAPIAVALTKDLDPPVIKVTQSLNRNDQGVFEINVQANDQSGIKEVHLKYLTNSGVSGLVPMKLTHGDFYQAKFTIQDPELEKFDYFIEAIDSEGNKGKTASFSYMVYSNRNVQLTNDHSSPVFSHFYKVNFGLKPLNYKRGANLFYPFVLKVKDNTRVDQVEIYYRNLGAESYQKLPLGRISDEDFGELVSASDFGIEFYFVAADVNGNVALMGKPDNPFKIEINQDQAKMGKLPSALHKQKENKGK